MATVEQGLQSQLRNIEATYGRSIDDWVRLIEESGTRRHGQIVTLLKTDYGLSHGAANRVALTALDRLGDKPAAADPVDNLYRDREAAVRAIHDRVMSVVEGFGLDVEVAPKKGYMSLRRRVQFAMLKPAAKHLDVGLVLHGAAVTDRFESAASFNALFTHRVRVKSVDEVDDELRSWLRRAYDEAA
jgi:hypothetical protein